MSNVMYPIKCDSYIFIVLPADSSFTPAGKWTHVYPYFFFFIPFCLYPADKRESRLHEKLKQDRLEFSPMNDSKCALSCR